MEAKKEERNLLSPNPVGRPDTQARVAKAIIGAKVFEFRATTHLQPFLISEPG